MSQNEDVAKQLQELRTGLEEHGVKSSWGALRVLAFDADAMTVRLTLQEPNYLFQHQFKATEISVPLLELLEKPYFTPSLKERRSLEALSGLVGAGESEPTGTA